MIGTIESAALIESLLKPLAPEAVLKVKGACASWVDGKFELTEGVTLAPHNVLLSEITVDGHPLLDWVNSSGAAVTLSPSESEELPVVKQFSL